MHEARRTRRRAAHVCPLPPPRPPPLQAGESPLNLGPPQEVSTPKPSNPIAFLLRLLLGTLAGFYYFCLPGASS